MTKFSRRKKVNVFFYSLSLLLLSGHVVPTAEAECLYGGCNSGLGVSQETGPKSGIQNIQVGQYKDGKLIGCATLYSGSEVYFGQVVDGKREGSGISLEAGSGEVRQGIWRKGRLTEEQPVDGKSVCAEKN